MSASGSRSYLSSSSSFNGCPQGRRAAFWTTVGVDGRPWRTWAGRTRNTRLLQVDLGAGSLELGLDLGGLVLGHAFLDGLRGRFDKILGFLEAEAGNRTHFLDHVDLVGADFGQDH